MALSRKEREDLARKRLQTLLDRHGVANARTIEQKISDAGPFDQRIDPHVLTSVRASMEEDGSVTRTFRGGTTWYFLGNTSPEFVEARLAEQISVFSEWAKNSLAQRAGQALEIATYRAMSNANLEFFGEFRDLPEHDDSTLYRKREPPNQIGRLTLPGDLSLDFLIRHPTAGHLAIECKNVREWLYPDRDEVIDLALKACVLDCVPVLIARRIPFVTFKLLKACGGIVHQTYNQLFPQTSEEVAARFRHKNLLGYHDIRLGNAPDTRLSKFVGTNLAIAAGGARERFEANKDLLLRFGTREIGYKEFAARLRRRIAGTNEDNDWPEKEPESDGNES